jgi:hypothetical protein
MNKIYKYDLTPQLVQGLWSSDPIEIEMPERSMHLDVQWNQGGIKLWCQIDPESPIVKRKFIIVGTGQDSEHIAQEGSYYLGTVQQPMVSTPQVWHVYEIQW